MAYSLTSRRSILRRTAAIATASVVAPTIIPASALGGEARPAPSNRINVGMIGTGRQVFYANLPWFLWSKDVHVVAACDVDAWRVDLARKKIEANYAEQAAAGSYKGLKMHRDFREVLASKDVDAVMISTPDHWHAYMAVEAMKAGKDVALEKPISLCVTQGRAIADAATKYNRVLRTDTEVRSGRYFQQLCQVIRNGRIGQVKRVVASVPKDPPPLPENPPVMPVPEELDYAMWQGPAPERPYTEQRVHPRKSGVDYSVKGPGWFHIMDYNLGVICNWGAHILDIVQWALDSERSGPVEVEGSGEFPKDNLWDVLQRFEIRYRYANGVEVHYTNGGKPFIRVEGTEGWIENTWFKSDGFQASDKALLKWKPGPSDVTLPCVDEKEDFINCVKSRGQPIIDAEVGHRDASMCQVGFISTLLNRKLRWDPAAERFTGDGADEANKLLTRPMRAPWTISL